MKVQRSSNALIVTGILLAVFAFTFGGWLGSRSGLQIMIELWDVLIHAEPAQEVTRQQNIFLLLSVLAVALVLKLVLAALNILANKLRLHAADIGLSIIVLLSLITLYVAYQAQTPGVILTAVGVSISTVGNVVWLAVLTPGFFTTKGIDGAMEPLPISTTREPATRNTSEPSSTLDTAAKAASDPMKEFQRKAATLFHECRESGKAFHLVMVGVPNFSHYRELFGEEAANEIVTTLSSYLTESGHVQAVTGFSTGSAMAVMTRIDRSTAEATLEKIKRQMRSHGFVGEMVLTPEELSFVSHITTSGVDGDTLATLTENTLIGYSMTTQGE